MVRRWRRVAIAVLLLLGAVLLGETCVPAASVVTPRAFPDADGDFVSDYCDNCRLVANRSQRDTDLSDGCVIQPGEEQGVCRDKPGQACTSLAECEVVRGNACDCDIDGNGVCNIDDFNEFLLDRAAGSEALGAGTDLSGDGVVDDLDFPLFEATFATGRPGEGALQARAVDGSCNPDTDPSCSDPFRPGACFETRIGRFFEGSARPWRVHEPSDGCNIDTQLFVDAGLPAGGNNLNNPTDALLADRSGGLVRCPNAAFGSFPSGYVCDTSVHCDPRDRGKPCGSDDGRGGLVRCGDVDLAPRACELYDVCESQCGYRSFDCAEQYRQNLFETCLALTGAERDQCLPTCLEFAEIYAGVSAHPEDPGGWTADDLEQEQALCTCCPDPAPGGEPPAACGDGVCTPESESCHPSSCPEDCGSCTLDARCLTDDDCGQGACSFRGVCELLPAGAVCDGGAACRSGVCDGGLCASSCGDGLCEGTESCGSRGATACADDCGACPAGGACDAAGDCVSGNCTENVCIGAEPLAGCSADGACGSGLCDLGTCAAAPKQTGESCGLDRACAGGICDLGFCVGEPKPAGSACGRHEACEKVVNVDNDLPEVGVCNLGVCLPEGNGVPLGGACDSDLACDDREVLSVNTPSVCNLGVCTEAKTIAIGGACNTDLVCEDFGACVGGVCKATFFSEFTCSDGSQCASGICDPVTDRCFAICGDGVCEPFPSERCGEDDLSACRSDCGQCLPLIPGQLGFGCLANDQCASGICNFGICLDGPNGPGTICSGDASCWSGICNFGVCTSETTGIGTPCTTNAKCESFACNFGFCVANRSLENGHPCTTGRACQGGVCNFGFCTDLLENDELCSANVNCQSGACNLGVCVPQGAVPTGVPCSSNEACRSGACGGVPVLDELNDFVTGGLLPLPGTCKEVCGDAICEGLETCGYGNPLLNCREDCGLCGNGSLCLGNFDCESGVCNFPACVAAGSVSTYLPCTTNAACASGRCLAGICAPVCGDGLCEAPGELCGSVDAGLECHSDCGRCANGTLCASNDVCASGVCNFPICIEARSVPSGGTCTTSLACVSGSCVAGLCVSVCGDGACEFPELCGAVDSGLECNADCGKCPNGTACASNAVCASGVCNFPICIEARSVPTGGTCTTSLACESGSCVAGLCVAVCGDGICEGGELCGAVNSGLECTADCGKCPNGTACASNAVCASGVCNFPICIAARSVPNGGTCTTNGACQSNLCILGFCTSCLPFTAACSSNAQCCSGSCVNDIFGNRSCGL